MSVYRISSFVPPRSAARRLLPLNKLAPEGVRVIFALEPNDRPSRLRVEQDERASVLK